MYLGYSFTKWLLSLSALGLLLNAPVLAVHYADDKSDAWENVSKMIRFIENGDLPSTELAGNRAVGSIEKAIDGEKDQGKRDKLRDAVTEVKEALSNASRGSWPYAEAAAKRALKLLEEAR